MVKKEVIIIVQADFFGAALAFGAGVAVAALNHLLSCFILKKAPAQYGAGTVLRQLIHIGFLCALYFLGGYTHWDRLYLLVGGALGVTLPMIWFTSRLLKLNNAQQQQPNGKEDGSNG